ncbi:MAG: DinB family protein, partial [Chloroflexota bacterium]|nr:DinB family protein [Chloroflexota bacterium]
LDYHRATLLMKCAGLSEAQLKLRSAEPSTLSLLGLVRHMTEVERSWFRRRIAGEDAPPLYYTEARRDDDFDAVDAADPTAMFATFNAEVERCRAIATHVSLDTVVEDKRVDPPAERREFSVRWIYVHMIEEYARHNGHADLLRERIDGARGD